MGKAKAESGVLGAGPGVRGVVGTEATGAGPSSWAGHPRYLHPLHPSCSSFSLPPSGLCFRVSGLPVPK